MRRPVSEMVLLPTEASVAAICSAVIEAIAQERLHEGDPVPSTRRLAAQVGCSRTTAVHAYDELVAIGYLTAVPGSSTRVTAGATAAARAHVVPHLIDRPVARAGGHARLTDRPDVPAAPGGGLDRQPRTVVAGRPLMALRPGVPDETLIDPADWRRAWRYASRQPIATHASWEHPSVLLEAALINHLRRHRGIAADHVHLASGASLAITAVAAAARLAAVIEDPGYRRAWEALDLAGTPTRPCPVDGEGLVVDHLPDESRLVYLTPAHQFPMGTRMSLSRRQRVIEWAHDTRSILIEDDYDGEFRYGVAPLPSLRSLPGAREVVVYIGTASKILTPTLQAAWIVGPDTLAPSLDHQLRLRRTGVAAMTAAALAHFIDSGALDRHIARAARTYAARRSALIRALHRHVPHAHIGGVSAGLHLRVDVPHDTAIADRMVLHGYQVEPLSAYSHHATASGLLLGYARLPETSALDLAHALRQSLEPLHADDSGAA